MVLATDARAVAAYEQNNRLKVFLPPRVILPEFLKLGRVPAFIVGQRVNDLALLPTTEELVRDAMGDLSGCPMALDFTFIGFERQRQEPIPMLRRSV